MRLTRRQGRGSEGRIDRAARNGTNKDRQGGEGVKGREGWTGSRVRRRRQGRIEMDVREEE